MQPPTRWRSPAASDGLRCVLNTGKRPLPLPDGEVLILASAPMVDGKLPPNAAAWLVVEAPSAISIHNP